MLQRVEMTYEEKVSMYEELSKDQLIRMLIEANRIIDLFANNPKVIGVGQSEGVVNYQKAVERDRAKPYKL